MNGERKYYGAGLKDVRAVGGAYPGVMTPDDLYDALCHVWCADTCAPRMREEWRDRHITWGQCSITAFLAQDIFGGEVLGVPLEDGNCHCFNRVQGRCFDLTSEQFDGKALDYSAGTLQSRASHFGRAEKYARYLLIKKRLLDHLDMVSRAKRIRQTASEVLRERRYADTEPEEDENTVDAGERYYPDGSVRYECSAEKL